MIFTCLELAALGVLPRQTQRSVCVCPTFGLGGGAPPSQPQESTCVRAARKRPVLIGRRQGCSCRSEQVPNFIHDIYRLRPLLNASGRRTHFLLSLLILELFPVSDDFLVLQEHDENDSRGSRSTDL